MALVPAQATAGAVFEPIPVIDLMGGRVVRARAGERASYRPLEGSRLAASAEPAAVVEALLALHPFRTLYVADLDAIQRRSGHASLIVELDRRFPTLELWVDAGLAGPGDCASFLSVSSACLVLGSESQADRSLLEALKDEPRVLLSLDSRGAVPLDPAGLFRAPELWPPRLIAMTLGRVGTAGGPDLAQLAELRRLAPDRAVYAAGGVRDGADLAALAAAGAAGVLLASALHDGAVGPADLARWPVPPRPPRPRAPAPVTESEALVPVTVGLPPAQIDALDAAALRAGRSRAEILREAVTERLKREPLPEDGGAGLGPIPGLAPAAGDRERPERDPWVRQSP